MEVETRTRDRSRDRAYVSLLRFDLSEKLDSNGVAVQALR